MDGMLALYIFMLAAFTGYEIIAKTPGKVIKKGPKKKPAIF